jgi:hypothetical protein
MGTIFGREPVLFLFAVAALLNLAVGFGLPVSSEQLALVNTAVAAVVSFAVRSKVTPV